MKRTNILVSLILVTTLLLCACATGAPTPTLVPEVTEKPAQATPTFPLVEVEETVTAHPVSEKTPELEEILETEKEVSSGQEEVTKQEETSEKRKPDGTFLNSKDERCPYWITYENGMISFEFYMPEFQPDESIEPIEATEYVISWSNMIYFLKGREIYYYSGQDSPIIMGIKSGDMEWYDIEAGEIRFSGDKWKDNLKTSGPQ